MDYIVLGKLDVQETKVDLTKHAVEIGKVSLTGGEVNAWLSPQGQLNLLELTTPGGGATGASSSASGSSAATAGGPATAPGAGGSPTPTPATQASGPTSAASGTTGAAGASAPGAASASSPTAAPAPAPAPVWTVSVPDITVDGFKVSAEDRQVTPALALVLSPINIHVAGYNTTPDAHLDITAKTTHQQQRYSQRDGSTFS